MTTTNKPPFELRDYQKAAAAAINRAAIRAMPVQFFWPPNGSFVVLRTFLTPKSAAFIPPSK
jgi:hypothetical protein